jgi:hypothetical protein
MSDDPDADEEARTTALGFFNFAASYVPMPSVIKELPTNVRFRR